MRIPSSAFRAIRRQNTNFTKHPISKHNLSHHLPTYRPFSVMSSHSVPANQGPGDHVNTESPDEAPPPKRPPYYHIKEIPKPPVLHGACYCKAVKFSLSQDEPLESKFCHCRVCQKLHGAPYQWASILPKDSLTFTAGLDNLMFYRTTTNTREYHPPHKVLCKKCGSPIMDEGRNMLLLFPSLIDFESREQVRRWRTKEGCHIFYGQRVVDVKDGLDKWRGHKGESEKMGEEEEE